MPSDCRALERPECEGFWGCDAGECVFECLDDMCTYACDLECPCAVDERGCDLPECDLSCAEAGDCEGLPHAPCEGAWMCDQGETCVWRCADETCGRIADEIEAFRALIAACDEGDVCKSADNQLCGNVGGCYIFYRETADFDRLRELERAYREALCFRPFCDHCAPPPPAECRGFRCVAID